MSDHYKTSNTPLARIDPVDLANYILAKLGVVDHLKLQKLLYYVQSWHLAFFGTPLFDEDFKAWVHGPVLLSVWHKLKEHSQLSKRVQLKPQFVKKALDKVNGSLYAEQIELVTDVLEEYGNKTGYHLEGLTHAEQPWRSARIGLQPDEPGSRIIRKATMKEFYTRRLQEGNG
jgi:uncharacterized phage-associated protein